MMYTWVVLMCTGGVIVNNAGFYFLMRMDLKCV